MTRRRPLGLAVLVLSAGAVLWWWWRRRPTAAPTADPTADPTATIEPSAPVAALPTGWAAPVDGACPEGFPVKVNTTSGIYHVPGGRFYDRASPHRCYATAEQAETDGYRRAKA